MTEDKIISCKPDSEQLIPKCDLPVNIDYTVIKIEPFSQTLSDKIVDELYNQSKVLMNNNFMERHCAFRLNEKFSDKYTSLANKWKEDGIKYDFIGTETVEGTRKMVINFTW